ncbi:hypothetical protein [Lichenibacterium ramalinae]|uniref:Uncharacterized protein n=1 Tax=Lichenibacterium ramalinae TaxID=2316527 RepID=A0A4Q2R622_9HYPH|nr:hypothetical protein [Lichenibacterium ramalinae]RYB01802.1 hypothetical protein D3272_24215 [Lichenibacterium ramalinae]
MSALVRFSSVQPRSRVPTLRGPVRRRLVRGGLLALAAVGVVASGLAAASALMGRPQPGAAPVGDAAWVEIRHPMALYDLSGTDFARLPATYRARRRGTEGVREDLLTFGRPGDGRPFLQLSLLRAPDPAAAGDAGTLADGLARLAGATGLAASRIHPLGAVDTRLGSIDIAELDLRDGDAAVPCLGFGGDAGGVLHLSGFACGMPGRPVSRAAVACAVDRLDLVSAGEDAALRAVFVAAERRGGTSCRDGGTAAGSGSPLAIGRHGGWLEAGGELPPLRGLFDVTVRQR